MKPPYRHVNIAMMNEMAIFSESLGVDLWHVIELASTKPFGFQAFYPSPGVGGHCIPADPNYLTHRLRILGHRFHFVELAQEINSGMPSYVVTRIQRALNRERLPVNGSRVLLLGVTYKADVADERGSPALPLGTQLLHLGADLSYHDPYVAKWTVDNRTLTCVPDVGAAAREAELVVLLQHHAVYRDMDLAGCGARVLDTRGVLRGETIERL